jgi:hypothetical protein
VALAKGRREEMEGWVDNERMKKGLVYTMGTTAISVLSRHGQAHGFTSIIRSTAHLMRALYIAIELNEVSGKSALADE